MSKLFQNHAINPPTIVKDERVRSKFYTKVRWFSLVPKVAQCDDAASRILLHDWVNNLPKQLAEHEKKFDSDLLAWTRKYFLYIQELLKDGSLNIYYERCLVMHADRQSPFPTKGLDSVKRSTLDRYVDTWYKFMRMLILGASDDVGCGFNTFGQQVLNDTIKAQTIQFVRSIQALFDTTADLDEQAKAAGIFPLLHSYFLDMAREDSPRARELNKSSITVFCAFKQLTYQGSWGSVRHIKAVPVMLKYCIRCVVLLDMLLKKGELSFDSNVDMNEINELAQHDESIDK
ncbi:hypothetical protein MBANPS3_011428 [Mucor bainieri]